MKRLFAAAAILATAGCAAPHQIVDRSDFLAEGTRTYKGIPRERVIEAARFVLQYSDPTDFEFRDSLTGFTGLRRYMVYAVLTTAQGREKWEFTTEASGKDVRASVAISEAGHATGSFGSTIPYDGKMASIPLYRLFWDRVDYMLGKRPDWVTCGQATAQLSATNTNTVEALSGLCGPTSDGRDRPAPPPLV